MLAVVHPPGQVGDDPWSRDRMMSSSKLGKLVGIHPYRNPSRTVFTPYRSPGTTLTPPSRPLVVNNSTEVLRMAIRLYNGRVTVSVIPSYNNRCAFVHLHRRTFEERHGCTRPSPTVPDQPTDDNGWRVPGSATVGLATSLLSSVTRSGQLYGRPLRSGKLHGSFERLKTSVALLRSGASV